MITIYYLKDLKSVKSKIDKIEMFLIHVDTTRHFSFGTWNSRQHLFVKLSSGNFYGWGEEIVTLNQPDFKAKIWKDNLLQLKGESIEFAFEFLQKNKYLWGSKMCEMVEMALIDLMGRKENKPAIDILNLEGRSPIPGIVCILENSIKKIKEKADTFKLNGFRTHVKLKLFGDLHLDKKLVKKVRESYGNETYIVGDANLSYHLTTQTGLLNELIKSLNELNEAGLNAIEDPSDMDFKQWKELRKNIELDLIPDEPLRLESNSFKQIPLDIGDIYNIHPGSSGSIIDSVQLGRRIINSGSTIMIGDNSLIGPACTIWQQIAIGLGAVCVEALEKPDEFNDFEDLKVFCPTQHTDMGEIMVKDWMPGFGLELNEQKLIERSKVYSEVI